MSVIGALPVVGKAVEKIMEKISPDRSASREAQAGLNRAELEGAPASRLRLWRSFLGWALSLCFVWEVAVQALLLGMLGLGF